MTTLRKMNVVMTLLMSADMETDENNHTVVTLKNVGNTVMATMVAADDAPETTPEFKNAVATTVVKAGLAYMVNDLNGEHKEPPPATNQPGASA